MADKAQSEPTMEEILASIRKIIADDGDTTQSSAQASTKTAGTVAVNVTENEDFDDLSLDDVVEENEVASTSAADRGMTPDDDASDDFLGEVGDDMFDDLSGDDEPSALPDLEPEPAARPSAFASDTSGDELEDFDFDAVDLDKDEPVLESASVEETLEEISPEWDVEAEAVAGQESGADMAFLPDDPPEAAPEPDYEPAPEPEPARIETAMLHGTRETPTDTQSGASGLTDERIAGAAASALGKLMVKQSAEDESNPNTLDGLMRELLRPMIKEWLDANLPAIVERKVEEEVQRIARMAR